MWICPLSGPQIQRGQIQQHQKLWRLPWSQSPEVERFFFLISTHMAWKRWKNADWKTIFLVKWLFFRVTFEFSGGGLSSPILVKVKECWKLKPSWNEILVVFPTSKFTDSQIKLEIPTFFGGFPIGRYACSCTYMDISISRYPHKSLLSHIHHGEVTSPEGLGNHS